MTDTIVRGHNHYQPTCIHCGKPTILICEDCGQPICTEHGAYIKDKHGEYITLFCKANCPAAGKEFENYNEITLK